MSLFLLGVVRVLNQSPNKKILLRFVEKIHHSLYLVEKLVLGCGLSLVFLVVFFGVFVYKEFFFSLQKRKVLEFVLEPSFL